MCTSVIHVRGFRFGLGVDPACEFRLEELEEMIRPLGHPPRILFVRIAISETEFDDHRLACLTWMAVPENQRTLGLSAWGLPELHPGPFDDHFTHRRPDDREGLMAAVLLKCCVEILIEHGDIA